MPAYEQYGISAGLVERVKAKMKEPSVKEKVMAAVGNVKKKDLQNRATVKRLLGVCCKLLGERLSEREADAVVQFVLDRKIDPNNPLHLLKLWGMFR